MTGGAPGAIPVPSAGDPLPGAVASLLAAFAAGDPEAAADCFAPDGLWAARSETGDAAAWRGLDEGAEAIRRALSTAPGLGHRHTVRFCAHEGGDCLLEGDLLDASGAVAGSHGASFQLDHGGLISRALTFRIEAVEDIAGVARGNPSGVDVRAKVDGYLAELEAARFESATTYFAADCLYLHPPLSAGAPRVTYRGTAGMMAFFDHRGAQPWRHHVDASVQRGPFLLLEGHVLHDGTPDGSTGSFLSSATVDEEGRILRYLAFYTAPMVRRR